MEFRNTVDVSQTFNEKHFIRIQVEILQSVENRKSLEKTCASFKQKHTTYSVGEQMRMFYPKPGFTLRQCGRECRDMFKKYHQQPKNFVEWQSVAYGSKIWCPPAN